MLFHIKDEIYIQWKRDKEWGNELLLEERELTEREIISSLVDVFIYFRLNRMIKKIAHDNYYYTDADEIERICQLTNWVISEKYYETFLFEHNRSLKEYITELLMANIDLSHPIHFDSLVTFNLKPLIKSLQRAVGYGIDEMKREEDYQSFIQSTREYITRRKTKLNELYIVQGECFSFYKANGKQYSSLELRTFMHQEPLYLLGLDENEMNLSPVISLLPKSIYIYGDHPSEPKTLTLINLFQERVQFFPKEQFPFHVNVK